MLKIIPIQSFVNRVISANKNIKLPETLHLYNSDRIHITNNTRLITEPDENKFYSTITVTSRQHIIKQSNTSVTVVQTTYCDWIAKPVNVSDRLSNVFYETFVLIKHPYKLQYKCDYHYRWMELPVIVDGSTSNSTSTSDTKNHLKWCEISGYNVTDTYIKYGLLYDKNLILPNICNNYKSEN